MNPDATGLENPYLALLHRSLGERVEILPGASMRHLLHRVDVMHVHWPEYLVRWRRGTAVAVFDALKTLSLIWIARRRGTALVWTAHNLEPHSASHTRLLRWYFCTFRRQVDLVISMSDGASETLHNRHPALAGVPVVVVPHGHYRDFHEVDKDVDGARAVYGLDNRRVLLIFGQIRTDKNVPALVRAWRALPDPRPQLVVAGRPYPPESADAIRQAVGDDPAAHLMLHHIADDDVPRLFAAADVVLAPHLAPSTLNSGVVFLALSLGRPIVVGDSAAVRDLATQVGPGWLYPCDGSPERAFAQARTVADTPDVPPDLNSFGWDDIGEATAAAYRRAVTARRRGRRLFGRGRRAQAP